MSCLNFLITGSMDKLQNFHMDFIADFATHNNLSMILFFLLSSFASKQNRLDAVTPSDSLSGHCIWRSSSK